MLTSTTITGREHRLRQQNCQDQALSGRTPGGAFGLVLDGCGSKWREHNEQGEKQIVPSCNEVGASLLGQFVASWLRLNLNKTACLPTLLARLYEACGIYLTAIVKLLPYQNESDRSQFIYTHLLCTLVGFVMTAEETAFFWLGDGYLCLNGQVTYLDSGNQPDYLAYQLLEKPYADPIKPETERSGRSFHIQRIPREAVQWLAVATDGWQPELLTDLAKPRPALALQRWVNVQAQQHGRFDDDGAVAVWHQMNG